MSLKAAIDIAAKFGGKLEWTQLTHFAGDLVRASNIEAGCVIPVSGLPPGEFFLESAKLKRMLSAIGDGAQVKLLGKGAKAKLEVKGGGSTFTLQVLPGSDHPGFPDHPASGWFDIPEDQTRAITAAASLVAEEATGGTYAIGGVRLGGGVAYGMTAWGGIRVILPAAVCPPTTIQKVAFDGLRGALAVAVNPGKAFVLERSTGQVRWTSTLEGSYPDAVFGDAVTGAVPIAAITVSAAELALLCRQAQVVEGFGFRLAVEGGRLTLRSSTSTPGPTGFDGAMDGKMTLHGEAAVGVQPANLAAVALAVAQAAGVEEVGIALGSTVTPMVFTGGEVATAVMMPVRL